MIKYIGAVLFVVCTTLAGQLFSHKLYTRQMFLQEFVTFLNTLETHIRYNNYEIKQLVTKCATSHFFQPIVKVIENDSESPFISLWKEGVKALPRQNGLIKEDYYLILEFGDGLGTTDIEGQINHIDLYKSLFLKAVSNATAEVTSKSKLYKMLGFFAGTAVALLII